MKSDLATMSHAKMKPGQSIHPNAHYGEAESVYWAATKSTEVVTSDDDTHFIAKKQRLRAAPSWKSPDTW